MRKSNLKYVQIFGERCSGTNYIERLVRSNFDIQITSDYGFKHWFVPDVSPRSAPNITTDLEQRRPLSDSSDTLFLFVFRNPYDWLRSCFGKPHHSHGSSFKDFGEFLRCKWTSGDTVQRCAYWRKDPQYGYYWIEEADSILHLRKLKISHFFEIQKLVNSYAVIRYEDYLRDPQEILNLAQGFHIAHKEEIVDIKSYKGKGEETFSRSTYLPFSFEDFSYINETLDWSLEASIGYRKTSILRWALEAGFRQRIR